MATVIKDEAIDPGFGTGVMTITPWHSHVDFEIAERHGLEKEQIIDENGNLLAIAGEFKGMNIHEARPLIVEKLRSKGLVVKEDTNYQHSVAVNERGKGLSNLRLNSSGGSMLTVRLSSGTATNVRLKKSAIGRQ